MRRFLSVLLVSAVALCAPSVLFAQNSDVSKIELFSGYSAYKVGGTFNAAGASDFVTGWASQLIIENSRWGGLVADFSRHNGVSLQANELAFGLRLQMPVSRFVPFGEALMGINDSAFKGLSSQVKPVWIAGGGIDVRLTPRLSMRPIEISYVGSSYNTPRTATSAQVNSLNGVRVQSGLIYNLSWPSSVGEVLADCYAEPPTVDAGVAVKINVKTKGFPSKRQLRYTYVPTGGTVAGNTATESVNTKGLSPGDYTIAVTVVNNGSGKHRLSAGCEANFSVTAGISRALRPRLKARKRRPCRLPRPNRRKCRPRRLPQLKLRKRRLRLFRLSRNRRTPAIRRLPRQQRKRRRWLRRPRLKPRKCRPRRLPQLKQRKRRAPSVPAVQESTNASNTPTTAATVQTPAMAPEAPAEAAKVPPAPSAPIEATKAPAPSVPAVQESTNASSTPATAAKVQTPAITPEASLPPQPSKFGAIAFSRDLKRPTRVDNEAKGELDRYADVLAVRPDCKGIVVGYTSAKEDEHSKQVLGWSGQRAVNTKNYLTKEKGIDPARIEPRIGSGDNQKTELWIVPAGGSFAAAGTTVVDESKVKAVPRVSLKARKSKTKMRKAFRKSNLHRSRNRHTRRVRSPRMRNTAHATLKTAFR